MTAENEARGRSNRAKGYDFMRKCVERLRTIGFPHAEIIPSHGRADIGGVGDLAVECKNEKGWDGLLGANRQAAEAAKFRDLPMYITWRRRWGYPDPLDGWCVLDARKWWEHWLEHQRLEAVELEFAAWRAGLAAAAQVADSTTETEGFRAYKAGLAAGRADAAAVQAREAAG